MVLRCAAERRVRYSMPRFRALLVYLRDYQLLPYERLTALCRDLLGMGVCKRTIETAQKQMYEALRRSRKRCGRNCLRGGVACG